MQHNIVKKKFAAKRDSERAETIPFKPEDIRRRCRVSPSGGVAKVCRDYRLQQEFITPYTPEQNGIIERFFRTLRRVCLAANLLTFEEARRIIRQWVQWCNYERPHQASATEVPFKYRTQQATQVA
jgi:transposase InsO family protein